MDKNDAFFHRLSTHHKEQYKDQIEKWILVNKPTYLERINTAISIDTEHLRMVQTCSRAFCGTELAEKSGFHFFCAEPLIEFGGLKVGNKSFDLLLFNEERKKIILIECKSSIGDIKTLKTEIEQSIQLVEQNKEYLAERVMDEISWDDCEYILCVTDKDSHKIEQSYTDKKSKNNKKSFDMKGFVNWIYYPYSATVQVSKIFPHTDPDLNALMQIGTDKKSLCARLDLPYCITSHPFIIIEQAVIGKCYAKQYAIRSTLEDLKIITKNSLMSEMMKSISLLVSNPIRKDKVKQRLEEIIAYGKKYDLFTEVDEESFRINCRGERPTTVLDALKIKLIENWAVYHATLEARKVVEIDMQKIISQKEISDF